MKTVQSNSQKSKQYQVIVGRASRGIKTSIRPQVVRAYLYECLDGHKDIVSYI